jgi:hypothetical protein
MSEWSLDAFNASAEALRAHTGCYDRRRMGEVALCFWPDELVCWQAHVLVEPQRAARLTKSIVRRLYCRCSSERRRGRAGHWTYNTAEHRALVDSLRAEIMVLRWQREWGAKLGEARERSKCPAAELERQPVIMT